MSIFTEVLMDIPNESIKDCWELNRQQSHNCDLQVFSKCYSLKFVSMSDRDISEEKWYWYELYCQSVFREKIINLYQYYQSYTIPLQLSLQNGTVDYFIGYLISHKIILNHF